MATFVAIVRRHGDSGYTASFSDFPECLVHASALDQLIANARESLLAHIEHLLQSNQTICNPTAVDAIDHKMYRLLPSAVTKYDRTLVMRQRGVNL